jgi:catechol 2,3-dioxygenase-like lactoylglutathione lyase family enzyme
MIAYVTIGAADPETAVKFYDPVLGAIDHVRFFYDNGWAGYHHKDDPEKKNQTLYVCTPHNGEAASTGNGMMVGLRAANPAQVRACHAAALANGGTSEGEPGPRPQYGPDLYVAYFRDPTGNKLSVVYKGPLED